MKRRNENRARNALINGAQSVSADVVCGVTHGESINTHGPVVANKQKKKQDRKRRASLKTNHNYSIAESLPGAGSPNEASKI